MTSNTPAARETDLYRDYRRWVADVYGNGGDWGIGVFLNSGSVIREYTKVHDLPEESLEHLQGAVWGC